MGSVSSVSLESTLLVRLWCDDAERVNGGKNGLIAVVRGDLMI